MAEPLFDQLFDTEDDRRLANQKRYPPPRTSAPEVFDEAVARERRDEAIAQVGANANDEWREAFYLALDRVARRSQEFTADEIWEELARVDPNARTHEPRAAGAVIVRGIKDGLIQTQPGKFRKSKRARCHHRPIQMYESLVCGQNALNP